MEHGDREACERQADQDEIKSAMRVKEGGPQEIKLVGLVGVIVTGMGEKKGREQAGGDTEQAGGKPKPMGGLERFHDCDGAGNSSEQWPCQAGNEKNHAPLAGDMVYKPKNQSTELFETIPSP
jgi:hypothetical protein